MSSPHLSSDGLPNQCLEAHLIQENNFIRLHNDPGYFFFILFFSSLSNLIEILTFLTISQPFLLTIRYISWYWASTL